MSSKYKVYFRLRPFIYFIARHKVKEYLCIVKKEWYKGEYYWKEI